MRSVRERGTMKKILIVEDNDLNLELCREIVMDAGYQVIEALSGIEAIDKATSEVPDLILMDIRLPGMDGVAALKKIKDLPLLKNIPVIALTGYAMDGDEDKFIAEGFSAYVSKPINFTALLEIIRKFT